MSIWRMCMCMRGPAAVARAVVLCTAIGVVGGAAFAGGNPACGPGAGDCCLAGGNGTPGCDDIVCCNAICLADPFCCDVTWDSICADEAVADPVNCPNCGGGGGNNDNCAEADPISLGDTPFSTLGATTDGPEHPGGECDEGGFLDNQVNQDIWYDFQATNSGVLTVSTCNQADYDTKLAVYDGCVCPMTDANLISCNDDGVNCAGFTSELDAVVTAGNCYKIRIGGFTTASGTGTVTLSSSGTVCGDGICDPGESPCNCPDDCGPPAPSETNCSNGVDDDCDGAIDCDDSDCGGDPACSVASCDFQGNPTLTQSASQTIVPLTGVACAAGGITTPNFFARSYNLAAIPETAGQDYTVHCVEVGIETNTGSDLVGTVSIYVDTDGGPPQGAGQDLDLLGSVDVLIPTNPDGAMIIANFDLLVPVVVPADSVMVVELFYPQHTNGGIWPGANGSGQTGPTYIMATDCGISSYVDMASIGFPLVHWVQNVVGEAGGGNACPWDLNSDTSVGILDLLSLLAAWGPNPGHPADFNGDGTVGILDLLSLLANWGPCP